MVRVLDLFSGAGGFSLGFLQEKGFEVKLCIDNNYKLFQTYIKNFPKIRHLNRDITSFSLQDIQGLQERYKFNIIIGGPPCQGFSLAGKIGRKESLDKRNDLFLSYLNFVKIIQPEVFVMENVATLKRHNGGKTLENIETKFKELGYIIKHEILNASDYGIAQNRRRIFIIGTKHKGFNFPTKNRNKISIKECIGDLPPLKSGENSKIPNHKAMLHSKQMLEKMSFVKDGLGRECIPEELRPKSGDVRKYIRYKSNEPSITITGDMRKVFHYSQNRALSARELARLQSFPDSFIFYGNSIDIQQQIGNAVPVKLAHLIAKEVKKYLEANHLV
ncbi:DNA (cytosine-5-)-methyltransferase [Campylobacter sp. MIT 99-7217]|uniref:DNA cytosine methyltransferase n=1 Tax=Campylobacter sp. MIT 99-7217 TaxID=535091 RepID=UPI00115A9003|nr:DNA cytosine methyltransferase [Campylobacter sp. MIT 99-7217]TQR31296.1 DNA (cytosine-5-)-methyltransferase [Campylobacter sp. MIT 99-7217]